MAHEGVVSLEFDANGVITYEVLGAERPARDWLSPVAAPTAPRAEPMGQWFAGPALEEPPKPLYAPPTEEAVFVSSPPRAWLWVPLLLIFSLFFLPFLFGLLFYCVSDTSGFGLFFLFSVFLLKAACAGGSCGQTYGYTRRCTRRPR